MSFFRRAKTHMTSGLSGLRDSYKEITYAIALARTPSSAVATDSTSAIDKAIDGIERIVSQVCETLAVMSYQQVGKTEQVREFMEDRGIRRDKQDPNVAASVCILIGCILVEGGLSAVLFFAGGQADLFISFAYGFSVAGINVSAGVIAGFVFGRAIGYKADAVEPRLRDALIRFGGWTGLVSMITSMLLMGFSAARVRVTGSSVDIFNFTEIGFAATFADYYGILLIVLGILGGIIAIREGWLGLSDPIIGYSKIWKQAEAELREAARDIRDLAQDAIEDIYEDLSEQLEDDLNDLCDLAGSHRDNTAHLISQITGHNLGVEAEKESARTALERAEARNARIECRPVKNVEFDAALYDALIIAEPDLPEPGDLDTKIAHLREARQSLDVTYQRNVAVLEQAYAGFLAGVAGLGATEENEGDHYVCEK